MGASIFSGNYVKILKSKFNLNDSAFVLADGTDPRIIATTAPIGSIHMNTTTGIICKKLDAGSSTNWSEIGSGLGGVNYIKDYDGSAIGSWVTYADAAGTSPIDGTGGSPSSTFAVSSDASMRGANNFLWTHSANNRQGEGFSYNFTIDPSDKGKVLQISFEYLIASGTYEDDGLQFWIYDGTNAALIQPAPFKLKNSGIIEKFAMEFQTSSNSTSYRLIAHVATSTATAYTIRFDNWNLGPQAKLYGSPITDWVAYTPTFVGFGTVTGINVKSRRVGDSLEVSGLFQVGTNTGVEAQMTLGFGGANSNVTFDSSKFGAGITVGVGASVQASTTYFGLYAITPSSSVGYINFGTQTSISAASTAILGTALSNSSVVKISFSVPIVGWSSSVVMSGDAATNVVAARATNTVSTTIATSGDTAIPYLVNTGDYDTNGGWSASIYTVPVSGKYRIAAKIKLTNSQAFTAQDNITLFAKIDGATYHILGSYDIQTTATVNTGAVIGGSVELNLTAGQTIRVVAIGVLTATKTTLASVGNYNSCEISRLAGPQQIAASESVNMRYINTAGTSLTKSTFTTIPYATKDFDTSGAFVTDTFTAPTSGKYQVNANVTIASGLTWASGDYVEINILKTGALHTAGFYMFVGATAGNVNTSLTTLVNCIAGDTIKIQANPQKASAGNATLLTSAGYNTLSIFRVGN